MPAISAEHIAMLTAANIPRMHHDTLLDTVTHGLLLKNYVLGSTYQSDKEAGRGLCIYGDPSFRTQLFPVFARSLVFANEQVLFIPLIVLREIVCMDNHPLADRAAPCSALFVSNFCTPGEPFPFSPMERAMIEQFLLSRCYLKLRNYYSASDRLENLSWWSEDFRAEQNNHNYNFSVTHGV